MRCPRADQLVDERSRPASFGEWGEEHPRPTLPYPRRSGFDELGPSGPDDEHGRSASPGAGNRSGRGSPGRRDEGLRSRGPPETGCGHRLQRPSNAAVSPRARRIRSPSRRSEGEGAGGLPVGVEPPDERIQTWPGLRPGLGRRTTQPLAHEIGERGASPLPPRRRTLRPQQVAPSPACTIRNESRLADPGSPRIDGEQVGAGPPGRALTPTPQLGRAPDESRRRGRAGRIGQDAEDPVGDHRIPLPLTVSGSICSRSMY